MGLEAMFFIGGMAAVMVALLAAVRRHLPQTIPANLALIAVAFFIAWLEWNSVIGFVHDSRAKDWPTTQGVMQRHEQCFPVYECGVTYSYEVSGRPYEGTRIAFTPAHLPKGWSRDDQIRWVERTFPVNQPVTVYYQPNNATNAALQVGVLPKDYVWTGLLMGALMIGLLFVGGSGLIGQYQARRARQHAG